MSVIYTHTHTHMQVVQFLSSACFPFQYQNKDKISLFSHGNNSNIHSPLSLKVLILSSILSYLTRQDLYMIIIKSELIHFVMLA